MAEDPKSCELLVCGAAELATPRGNRPLGGAEMGETLVLSGGAVAIDDGRIVAVGAESELRAAWTAQRQFDAQGGTLVPGFVDAHTHPVFASTREDEFEARVGGATYLEIAAAGGGILSTVQGVRAASKEQLLAALLARLDRFIALGTTTIEAKSGYGLSVEDEMKSLEVLAAARAEHALEIVPTFLGAHDVPPEFRDDRQRYISLLLEELLPRVAESGLAEYCDVFTEKHTFGLDDSRLLMRRGAELGLGVRMHVDQLSPLGGAQLAAELGAASADHLEWVSDAGMDALLEAGVVPVLCPLVPIFLREEREAPGRRMVDAGLGPALATDFNPGSCYLQSLTEVLSFAALRYGMSAGEALCGATLNAACSLGRGDRLGTLEPGKDADLVVLDVPNHRHLTYELGRSPVRATFKRGALAYERAWPA